MYYINLIPGDVLRRRKGPVWHWGVCLTEGILHNTPSNGEHISSLEEFANGNNIEIFQPQFTSRQEIISRANSIVLNPSNYQYLWRNCEHTITEITKGRAESQTINILVMVLLAGGTYFALKNKIYR